MINLVNTSLNNDISLITLDDNLSHSYFTSIKWEKDNITPIGFAEVKMPFHDEILNYWITYYGTVVIHAQLIEKEKNKNIMQNLPNTNFKTKNIKQINKTQEDNKIRLQNDEYNYSFIGSVHDVKRIGQTIIIRLQDLGWKFMQKVPKEFRSTYIAGQPLGNAFQAICEFIGVDFAYSIEDLNKYNFSLDGYSIEKGGEIIEETPSILSINNTDETDTTLPQSEDQNIADAITDPQSNIKTNVNDDNTNENNNENNDENDKSLNSSINNSSTSTENNTLNENETVNNTNTQQIIEKYQEEFDEKIKNLFIGNTMYDSNVSDAILNYDAITIQPVVTTSSNTSVGGNTSSTSENNENNDENNDEDNDRGNTDNEHGRNRSVTGIGETYTGKKYLTKEYINNMTPATAKRVYEAAQKSRVYTRATMEKLYYRSLGIPLF